jgi:ApaG protein
MCRMACSLPVISEVSHGIRVSVEVTYRDDASQPVTDNYVWSYRITIHNNRGARVRLLSRFWEIRDALNGARTVAGDGVVGEQPELINGASHTYVSGCQLQSPYGNMEGFYLFEECQSGERFEVRIPRFKLQLPFLLN